MNIDEKFNNYLKEVELLAKDLDTHPENQKEILNIIVHYREELKGDKDFLALLMGEEAVYKEEYSTALLHYLKSPKNPFFLFLYDRASALLHFQKGNFKKAKEFAEKAQKIFPDDYLLSKLVKQNAIFPPSQKATELSYDAQKEFVNSKKDLLRIQAIYDLLLEGLDFSKVEELQNDKAEYRIFLLAEIEKLIPKISPGETTPKEYQDLMISVLDEVLGFGPIEPLLREETITDIFVNGPNSIYIERKGRIEKTGLCFLDNEHIYRLVQRVASKAGRHLDIGTPYFDAQLPDGSRIHAIIPPCAIDGIKVSLRKYHFQKFHIQKLVEGGSLKPTMATLLQLAVRARLNIAICGGTGSGKTTLMNSLLASINSGERIITIEDTPELEPPHHNTVRLLTRMPNPEGKGAVTQADLMINALRMRPDRVILGELRGAEAFNMLHAMNTGQDGSMVTLHASGPEEVVSRLVNMILMARYALSADSVRQQVASALDIIIYVARLFNGSRRVLSISQISSVDDEEVKIEDIFRFDIEKITADELVGDFKQLNIAPTKKIMNKLITSGLINEYQALFDQQAKPVPELQK